jgi:hypothetical protein
MDRGGTRTTNNRPRRANREGLPGQGSPHSTAEPSPSRHAARALTKRLLLRRGALLRSESVLFGDDTAAKRPATACRYSR